MPHESRPKHDHLSSSQASPSGAQADDNAVSAGAVSGLRANTAEAHAAAPARKSLGLMIGLSAGHGIKHFGQGALLLISPHIREAMSLSEVAFGGIATSQSAASGVANVPAGILSDVYRRRVAWLLTISMLLVGTGYLVVGISPWYWLILMAVMIIGFGTSLWHAPAFGTLAANYPERRGMAMSAHLTGAQIGNTLSPIIIGLLLSGFTIGFLSVSWEGMHWRVVSVLLFIPAALTAVAVFTRVKTAGKEADRNMTRAEYMASVKRLVTNVGVLGMVVLGAFRGAVHTAFQAFLVLYMTEELEYTSFVVGLHVALITMAGIVSTPLMGIVSDKIGRKPVIATAMSLMAVLIFFFLRFNTGAPMTVLIGFLGLFFFSVMPIIQAAAMDQIDRGSEGSGTALMFSGGALIGSTSPIVAGVIYHSHGFTGVVWMAGCIASVGAVLAIVLPMKRKVAA